MRHMPTFGLSLAFQRTFPHVYDHVQDLMRIKKQGSESKLTWPSWCCFPVGLSYDLLRQRYGYAQDGVEPFLLSALVGFRAQRTMVHLDGEEFQEAAESEQCTPLPVSSLFSMPRTNYYVAYPEDGSVDAGALGAFMFLDYNGPGEESLIFVLHLASYHVEPVCFPLSAGQNLLEEVHFDLERALHTQRPAGLSPEFYENAISLCRINLRVLAQQTIPQTEAVLQ